MDDAGHEPPGVRVELVAWLDRTVEDPIVPDAQPLPWRCAGEGLDVELGLVGSQTLERLANPREGLSGADVAHVPLSPP